MRSRFALLTAVLLCAFGGRRPYAYDQDPSGGHHVEGKPIEHADVAIRIVKEREAPPQMEAAYA